MPYANNDDKRDHNKRYYRENAKRIKKRERKKYDDNRSAIRARRKEIATPELRARNAERERKRYEALRSEMLIAYGGKCACCGEDEPLFLELDHIDNDGADHRRFIGRGAKATYAFAKRKGWPKDQFQLLCANCNQGKKRNGGVCPHQR